MLVFSYCAHAIVNVNHPRAVLVFSYCEVEASRQRLMQVRETAYANNLELVAEGVQLRRKTAGILGYPSWAHFVTETRMAGSPEAVVDFLAKIRSLATEGAKADLEELRLAKVAHLQERGELDAGNAAAVAAVAVEAWDTSFYHNRILKQKYGADTEAVRQYFPLAHVVATTLQLYQELLGLVFTEVPKGAFQTWHEDVRLFVVHDEVNNVVDTASAAAAATEGTSGSPKANRGRRVGHFYLDLHPRDGK